jgi:repressor LexA
MIKLTERQREVLDFILSYRKTHGFPPSIREIMDKFSFRSPRTVSNYLEVLEKKGALRIHRRKTRGIEIIKKEENIPILGRIPAGFPEEPFEDVEEYLPVDPDFFGKGTKFAVRVKGDSMEGVGIKDGDIVIIRKQPDADDGQIVAALIEGEVTLKRLKKTSKKVELRPENPRYEIIYFEPPDQPQILGVMVGLIRRV